MRNEFMPGDLPPQYGPVFQDTSRQMKLADLLRQQSLEMPEGQMVSGIYVPPAITQYMAQALKGYNANKMEADAQSKQKAAYDDFQTKRTNATQALIDGLKTKTVDQPVDYSDAGGMPGMTEQVQQQPDFNAAFTNYLNSGVADPAMVAYVTGERNYQRGREDKLEDRQENRAAQAQARQEQREARMQELQLRMQDAATSRAEQAALRKELFQMQNDARRDMMVLSAANRPAPAASPVTVMRDGKPTIVDARTGQMIGEAPAAGFGKPMSSTAQKELIETDDQIQGSASAKELFKQAMLINDKAMGFRGAGAVAAAGSLLPEFARPESVDATADLDNILQNAALPQLKAIFGGMPTEGERAILLEVQGSSSKSPAVRKKIFDRALKAIDTRMRFAQDKAKALRTGNYFSGDGGVNPAQQTAPSSAAPATEPTKRSREDVLKQYKVKK